MSDYPTYPLAATNGATPHLDDETLAAWAADELSGDERERTRRHLASCAMCQQALAQTQRIQALLRATTRETGQSAQATTAESVVAGALARLPATETPAPIARTVTVAERPSPPPRAPNSMPRPDRWRRIGALAAVVVLIAASALLFSRLAFQAQSGKPTPTVETPGIGNIPGNWRDAIPAKSQVSDIAVVSPTDIWVVGAIVSGIVPQALLMHFDGKNWQQSPDQFPYVYLTSVSMDSPTDGWAVGDANYDHPALLHFSNGHWHDATSALDTSGAHTSKISLSNVRMASATSGWMLGSLAGSPPDPTFPAEVFEYLKVGTAYRWEPVSRWEHTYFDALSVVSDHEVWLAGTTGTGTSKEIVIRMVVTFTAGADGPTATHWDTHSWDLGDGSITGLSMRSSTEGWAVGGDPFEAATAYQWNGQDWSANATMATVASAEIGGVLMTGEQSGWVYTGTSDKRFLYSTQDGTWFNHLLPQDSAIAAIAPISPTAILAFTMTTVQSQEEQGNWDPEPLIYTIGKGIPVAVSTSTP